ncbi:MAG: FmdE family protein [Thermodesulfobacteriota bacterium]|nr:FmdE family protein [Thermodesulfobacteriota bacterium]
MKTKRIVFILSLVMLVCSAFSGIAMAQKSIVNDYPELNPVVDFVGENNLSVLHLLGIKASIIAMKELAFSKGDPNILAFTDAGYIAKIGDYTTEKALDGVMMTTGASRGKGNLVNVHKPYNATLWFAFFHKENKACVYLETKSDVLKIYLDRENTEIGTALRDFMKLKDDEIFSSVAKENIDANKLLSSPEAWQKKMIARVFGGNEFSLFTIANLWAMGLPNDFLKVAELHDHICPGLTSGYLIAEYLKKNLHSLAPRHEYTIIAIPPWCKDDALIQIFETNVGHKRLFVKWLTKEQKKRLPKVAKNVANIVIRWERGAKKGKGIVVAFNWDKVFKGARIKRKDFMDFKGYGWWWTRLKMVVWMMNYLDKPEALVSTIKEFEVKSPAEIEKLKAAGVNPLVELGIMPRP